MLKDSASPNYFVPGADINTTYISANIGLQNDLVMSGIVADHEPGWKILRDVMNMKRIL